jgi:hypothetical protein
MQLLSEILLARENAEPEPLRGRAVEEGPASGVPGHQPAAPAAEDFGAPAAFINAAEAFLASGLPDADAGVSPAVPWRQAAAVLQPVAASSARARPRVALALPHGARRPAATSATWTRRVPLVRGKGRDVSG